MSKKVKRRRGVKFVPVPAPKVLPAILEEAVPYTPQVQASVYSLILDRKLGE